MKIKNNIRMDIIVVILCCTILLSGCSNIQSNSIINNMFTLFSYKFSEPYRDYELKMLNGSSNCMFQDVPLNTTQLNNLCVGPNQWHLININFGPAGFENTCCNDNNYCIVIYMNDSSTTCPISYHSEAVNDTYINGTFYKYGGCCFWDE